MRIAEGMQCVSALALSLICCVSEVSIRARWSTTLSSWFRRARLITCTAHADDARAGQYVHCMHANRRVHASYELRLINHPLGAALR